MDLTTTKVRLTQYILLTIVIFLSYYLAKTIFNAGINLYNQYFAGTVSLQESAFGKLPQLKFKRLAINTENPPTYRLNLTNQSLDLPSLMYIYRTQPSLPTITNESEAKSIATNLNFDPEKFVKEDSANFKFTDSNRLRQMLINVVNKNLTLVTDFNKLATITTNLPTITGDDATAIARTFLLNNNILLANELNNAVYKTIPTTIFANSYQELETFNEDAKLQKVIIYRALQSPVGRRLVYFPILNEYPDDSNNYVIVTQEDRRNSDFLIAEARIDRDIISYTERSPYPLADPIQIWEQKIKRGQGVITQLSLRTADHYQRYDNSLPLTVKEIEIRDIRLTYFESPDNSNFIQPIYVYTGRFELLNTLDGNTNSGNVVIYYPAISGEWVE